MPKMIARLLGLGAYAASVAFAVLFVLLAYASRPTPVGGIDDTLAHVTWLAMGGVMLAIAVVHIGLGKQLMVIARDGDKPQPLGAR